MTDQMTAYEKNSHVAGLERFEVFMRECVTSRQIAATHTTVSPMRIKIDKLIFFFSSFPSSLSFSASACSTTRWTHARDPLTPLSQQT